MPGNRQIGVVESDRKPTESTLIDSAKARFSGLITGNFGTHSDLVRLLLGEAGYLAGRLNGFLKPELQQIRGLVLVYVCLGDINRSPFAENLSISMRLHAASIGLSASSGAPAFDTAAFRHRSHCPLRQGFYRLRAYGRRFAPRHGNSPRASTAGAWCARKGDCTVWPLGYAALYSQPRSAFLVGCLLLRLFHHNSVGSSRVGAGVLQR